MCMIRGTFGMTSFASCTFVVISQTKMFAYVCAEAIKSSRKSFDSVKQETSGEIASNLFFSGLKKDCVLLG